MGKLTMSMAIFNSYVKLPEGNFFPLFFGCQEQTFETPGPVSGYFMGVPSGYD